MTAAFVIVALITVAGAVAATALRQIVHCVLCLAISFTGIAMLYLQLGAQFLGFAQFLVYIGAVTILMLFTILLTRNTGPDLSGSPFSRGAGIGVLISASVFGCLAWAITRSPDIRGVSAQDANVSVKAIGLTLMQDFVIPLEVIALLLTAAMVGAVVIAMNEPAPESAAPSKGADSV